jgi:hypothetical protein
MRKLLFLLPLMAVVLFSCQKEINFLNGSGGGGGSTGGNRLVKTVSKTASDSVITIYTYNSSGKLINVTSTGISNGQDAGNEYKYYRNASGIITRRVQINPNLVVAGIDSVITIVHYNTATSRYTSSVFSLSLFGLTVNDSSVHVYDAAGKLIRTDEYQAIVSVGQPYELSIKTMYTYDAAGNIKQFDLYSHDVTTSTDDLISTVVYTFDSKTAAISYGADAIGVGQPDLIAVNNILNAQITDVSDPANNQTIDFTYTYNSNNRPVTGTSTLTPGGSVKNLSFYYQ